MNDKVLLILLKSIKKYPNKHIFDIYKLLKDKVGEKEFISCFDKSDKVGYVSKTNGIKGDITPLGKNKLIKLEEEIKEKETIKNLTLKELEGNVFQLKYWYVIILINFIISILIAVITAVIVAQ